MNKKSRKKVNRKKVNKKKNKFLLALKIVLIVLAVLTGLAGGYVGYAYLTFNRLGDRELSLEYQSGVASDAGLSLGKTYSIMTANLGFGAYSDDFDFFMDGGHESWAFSRKDVYKNIDGLLDKVLSKDPDFIIFQEIDRDSTRSYHIDQLDYMNSKMMGYYYSFAYNLYKSPYYVIPIYQPHGTITAGIGTFSKLPMSEAKRMELPIMDSITKFFDLDRCYSVSKIPVDGGKSLCLYNIHLSAYGSDDSVREGQLKMLIDDMTNEYLCGNYIICGGDFNHDLSLDEDEEPYSTWAYPFPRKELPKFLSFAMDKYDKKKLPPTGRDNDAPYTEGITKVFILDGFIVSDNVEILKYENMYEGFKYSDHEPVYMSFKLK